MRALPSDGSPMPRPRRFFPPEYKAEVVELICSTGKTVGQVARELDLTETAVGQWIRQAELDAGHRHDGLTTAEREELGGCAARSGAARGARDLAQGRGFLRQGDRSPVSCYRLIDQEKAHHTVSRLARVLVWHARAITPGAHVQPRPAPWRTERSPTKSDPPAAAGPRRPSRARRAAAGSGGRWAANGWPD